MVGGNKSEAQPSVTLRGNRKRGGTEGPKAKLGIMSFMGPRTRAIAIFGGRIFSTMERSCSWSAALIFAAGEPFGATVAMFCSLRAQLWPDNPWVTERRG